jgi:hypothetical protein
MGLFSWNCKKCDHSIKVAPTPDGWQYMNEATYLKPNGSVVIGEYDGYGRIDGCEIDWESGEPEVWHKRCWENAGKPSYTGPSKHADDQGYFYNSPTEEEMKQAIQESL